MMLVVDVLGIIFQIVINKAKIGCQKMKILINKKLL